MNTPVVLCRETPNAVASAAAHWIIDLVKAKLGPFNVALAGGSTPRSLYAMLARAPFVDELPWVRMHWFFGDERCVPSDDVLSNFHMVNETMFVVAKAGNVHPVNTESADPAQIAANYEGLLKSHYGAGSLDPQRCLFDLTLLGIGPDGHIASLFPGTKALSDRTHWVAPVAGPDCALMLEPIVPRITLTYMALNSSAATAFLVTGAAKRDVLLKWLSGDKNLPCSRLNPVGPTYLFVDRAACPVVS